MYIMVTLCIAYSKAAETVDLAKKFSSHTKKCVIMYSEAR